VLLVTGYSEDALANLMGAELGNARLEEQGATGILGAMYRMEYSIVDRDVET
jgi:hypothetical protein